MPKVLITGGAGVLGSLVAIQLREAGYAVRIMSRQATPASLPANTDWAQADLETRQGLMDAVQGVDVIVHSASGQLKHTVPTDVDGTRALLKLAREAGVSHFVYISIVGIDRIPYSYYRHKLAAENLIQQSGIPWSILRATQFHSLLDLVLRAVTRLPLIAIIPTDLKFQPVAESEVAARLYEIVQAGPSGRVPNMGGPVVCTAGELARTWLALRGIRRIIIPLWLPGKVGDGCRRGYNTDPKQSLGKITWSDWVKQKYQSAR